jgi:hypothetical protein
MSDLTPDDRALLDLARGGHDPGSADRDRVRGALAVQLGVAAGLVSTSAGAVGGASAAGGVLSGAGLVAAKVVGAVIIVCAASAGGVAVYRAAGTSHGLPSASPPSSVAGARMGAPAAVALPIVESHLPFVPFATATSPAEPTPRAAIALASVERAPSPSAKVQVREETRALASRSAGATAEDVTATNRPPPDTAGPASAAPGGEDVAGPAAAPLGVAGAASPSTVAATTLRAETELIRGGLAALHENDPARALALFDEHARRFPTGVLADERDVERVTALCDLGRSDEARAAVSSFVRRRPDAPLTRRLLSSCGHPAQSIP